MNKVNTIIAIIVCALLPVFTYFIVKRYTDRRVHMPKRYFYDAVVKDTVDGKKVTDTFWHPVKNFNMVNQYGDTVNLDMVKGKVLIIDFFFTHCPTICPTLTRSMKKIQQAVLKDTATYHLISITIDPKRDTTQTLRDYAVKNDIKHDNWWLARIVGDTTENILYKEFKAGFKEDSIIQFDHTPDIYLLDRNRVIRGKHVPAVITEGDTDARKFYDGTDSADVLKLVNDAGLLKIEKTEKGKPPVKYMVASMIIMAILLAGLLYYNQKRKKALQVPKS
jgi:protein SCO1